MSIKEYRNNAGLLFVLFTPIINALATLFTSYFPAGNLNPGTIRALILGVFFVYFLFKFYPLNRPNVVILVILIYFFFLVVLSASPGRSLYVYLRFFIASMMFPVGYYYINNLLQLRKLYLGMLGVLSILIISIVISNIFGIGSSDYLDESFYFGEYGVNITKNLVVLLMLAPIYFIVVKERKWRYLGLVLFILALIFVILGVKRSAMLALIAGFIIYFYLSPRKLRSFRIIFVTAFFLIIASPYFFPVFFARYEARQQQVGMSVRELDDQEGRVMEFDRVMKQFYNSGIVEKLIGSDVFIGRDLFGTGRTRMIHVDYMSLLASAGIIGLFLFLLKYFVIYKEAYRFFRLSGKTLITSELYAVFCALIVAQAFLSIGGSIQGIDLRGLILINLGAITGTLRGMAHENWLSANIKNE